MLNLFIFFTIVGIIGLICYQANRNPRRMPKRRKIIGYKKVYVFDDLHYVRKIVIATLEIPRGTDRYQESRKHKSGVYLEPKCRTSEAKVLSLKEMYTGKDIEVATSGHDMSFNYRVGDTVRPRDGFDPAHETCASGIHFYMLKRDAERH